MTIDSVEEENYEKLLKLKGEKDAEVKTVENEKIWNDIKEQKKKIEDSIEQEKKEENK